MTQEDPALATYVGRDDLLSRALPVPEYDGRVRGTGFAVTPSAYFGRQKRSSRSDVSHLRDEMASFKHQMQELQQQMRYKEQREEQFTEQMRLMQEQNALLTTQIQQLVQGRPTPNVPFCDSPSFRDSCNSMPKVPFPSGEFQCKLYVEQASKHAVAVGVAYNTGEDILHNSPLPDNTLRVRVDVCTNEDALLPIPSQDEQNKVADVVGGYVAWPIGLIEPCGKGKISKSSTTQPKSKASASQQSRRRHTSFLDQLISIAPQLIGEGAVQLRIPRHIYSVGGLVDYVTAEVVQDICARDWVSASAINIWIRHLDQDVLMDTHRVQFAFVNPFLVGHHEGKVDVTA